MAIISKNDKGYFIRRLGNLDIERQSFISHWKELSEFIEPRRGRFFIQDRNKGDRRHTKIINSRATQAHRSAVAGLFAGTMSPNRPNFKLETLDNDLMRSAVVRDWLYKVETLIRAILLDSNFYNMAPIALAEGVLFGTGAMSQVDDFDSVARFYTHTAGSYYIGVNDHCEVDTFVLEQDRTVKQIVEEFGLDVVSPTIRGLWDKGDYDKWYTVVQFIEPNPEYDVNKPNAENKKYRSVWFEWNRTLIQANTPTSAYVSDNKFLRKSGFDEFPIHTIRWALAGEDIYGTNSPGMVALGDVKALQIMEKRKAQAVDKLVNPPLKGPPSLTNVPISSLPGGVTLYDADNTKEGLTALYQVDPRLQEMRADIQATEQRINEAFFVDLFLAITSMEGVQPRNQLELTQRNQERLLMLGPPLERLQQDFLSKIVERTFKQCIRANILPPPPSELQGQALNTRFISALAQAQRAIETGVIERVAQFAGSLTPIDPQIVDKINFDEMVEQYARMTGAIPSIIVPQEQVIAVRQARQQQQQQMQQAAIAQQMGQAANAGASGVKNLADAFKTQ